ncbi:unnamed protein product [Arctogadus glacialis]
MEQRIDPTLEHDCNGGFSRNPSARTDELAQDEYKGLFGDRIVRQRVVRRQSSVTAQKRACNTATCVTHRLADFLSRSGGIGNSNFVPTNVGSKAFGRRRRNAQA